MEPVFNNLPYGRTKDRSDYASIIKEQKGTCSTKHAFLKAVAQEHHQDRVKLYLGIYKMNALNTKGIETVLENYKSIKYIPEAHSYLKIDDAIIDITRTVSSKTTFEDDLLTEMEIVPNQIGHYKEQYHQNYIKTWIVSENINYSFHEIWQIREACIAALSQ